MRGRFAIATDLTGDRFGNLVVVAREALDRWQHALFRCRCDCGGACTVRGADLKRGFQKTCGLRCPLRRNLRWARPPLKGET
jgi:hypothetical protein